MRKSYCFALLAAFAALFAILPVANATTAGSQLVRLKYSATNVTKNAYVELVTQTTRGIRAVSAYNSSGNPVELAFGAAGSEVPQMVIPAATAVTPVVYPLTGGYGLRLSVIALDGTNSTGELEVNLFYN